MHTSDDFVREIRARYPNTGSDYGLAKALRISNQSIYQRQHRRGIFSDETGERIAELLDYPPAYVLACLAGERTKRPTVRAVWQGVAAQFRHGKRAAKVATVLLGLLILPPYSAVDASVTAAGDICILCKIRLIAWLRRLAQGARRRRVSHPFPVY